MFQLGNRFFQFRQSNLNSSLKLNIQNGARKRSRGQKEKAVGWEHQSKTRKDEKGTQEECQVQKSTFGPFIFL